MTLYIVYDTTSDGTVNVAGDAVSAVVVVAVVVVDAVVVAQRRCCCRCFC